MRIVLCRNSMIMKQRINEQKASSRMGKWNFEGSNAMCKQSHIRSVERSQEFLESMERKQRCDVERLRLVRSSWWGLWTMGGERISDAGLICFCYYYCQYYHQLLFVEVFNLVRYPAKALKYVLSHLPVPKISFKYRWMVKVA